MTNTAIRVLILAILVGLLAASMYVMPQWLQPKSVQLPKWDPADMPLEFGSWQGAEVESDPEVQKRLLLDADAVVDRAYRDNDGNVVSVHAAFFRDLDAGVLHRPSNCYLGAGYRQERSERLALSLPDGSSIPVDLTTWEKEGKRVLVMYWYQLDEHILFDRGDLFWTRLKMRSKDTWPAMVKVLLQGSADDPDKDGERIQKVAGEVYQWINEPHQPSSAGPVD